MKAGLSAYPAYTASVVSRTLGGALPYKALETSEQCASALPVLKAAWVLVRRGWCRAASSVDADGRENNQQPVAWSLYGAIKDASTGINGEHARRIIRRLLLEHDLVAWNNHPLRRKGDVLRLLERAVRVAEGRTQHRGGWVVTGAVAP